MPSQDFANLSFVTTFLMEVVDVADGEVNKLGGFQGRVPCLLRILKDHKTVSRSLLNQTTCSRDACVATFHCKLDFFALEI